MWKILPFAILFTTPVVAHHEHAGGDHTVVIPQCKNGCTIITTKERG